MGNEDMDAFVEQVRSQSDILSVVSSYLPMKRKGRNYWGCCPFHREKTPSFSVAPEKGFFYCFGCHAGGDVFKFISLMENVSYFEAIRLQGERLHIPLPERQKSPQEIARDQKLSDLRKVNGMARDFFHNCLTMTRYGAAGKSYLASRGISRETVEEFQMGFAPDSWDKLTTAFLKRGVRQELLLEAGLVSMGQDSSRVYDRFRNRIMIPIADERGNVVGFGGRVLDEGTPKYLNTQETMLFNKRKLLFGLDKSHRAIQQAGYAIVVEGYMDAISVFGAGVRNVVASLGTAFTPEQGKKLLRYAPRICFCYDSDEAGQAATVRAMSVVRGTGAEVSVIVVPGEKDPDEFIRHHGAKAFMALAEQALPLVEFRLRYVLAHTSYDTLEGKVKALHEMLPVLDGIRDGAELAEYRKKLARTLMLDEGIVAGELRHYAGMSAQSGTSAVGGTARTPVRVADSALKRAGRIVIRMAWQDASVLAHIQGILPLSGIGDEAQREILEFLSSRKERGESFDVATAAEVLSEKASAELSRALVESEGEGEETTAYNDSILVLRRAYLNTLFMEHSRRAEEYLKSGNSAYHEELGELKRIKEEMDDLQVDQTV